MELPPALAEAAIIGPTSELVHRVEIFEADATTRWDSGAHDDRLINGSVSIDYSRDERRSVDLELDNSDFGLEHTPEAFWYDKILKVYCGVNYVDTTPVTSQRVRTNIAYNPRLGTGTTHWGHNGTGGVAASVRVTGTGFIVSDTAFEATWSTGTTGVSGGIYYWSSAGEAGLVVGETFSTSVWVKCSKIQRLVMQLAFTNDAGTVQGPNFSSAHVVVEANTWTRFSVENATVADGATRFQVYVQAAAGTNGSNWGLGNKLTLTGLMAEAATTAKDFFCGASLDFANYDYAWVGTADASRSTETVTFTTESFVDVKWEVQVGEFMIDSINEDHFPYTVKVTGRDYTKKCLLSKFATATGYADGTAIETAIKSMAQAAGISKFIMPPTGHALGKDYVYERGVARWEAMKDIADAFSYELFFDAQGYLVMREFLDPVTSPIAYTFATGPLDGNLVSYSKNLNDNRIYNKIVVTGESSDASVLPVSAIATNTAADSPTSIAKLGERVYQYTSAFITTTQQAQDVANNFLKIHALEEFDLNFSAIALPWLEVGEIIEFIDPRPSDGQPTRFLLSSISIPLGLEAMSGNAKRVSVVG
jgi:hypothetical protein